MANAEVGQYNNNTGGTSRQGEPQFPAGDVYAQNVKGISRQEYQQRYFYEQINYNLTNKISAGEAGMNQRYNDLPLIDDISSDSNMFRQKDR
jgi:hypothetical protein